MNGLQRWRLRAERVGWRLDRPRVLLLATYLVPLLFGLLAVAQRQDSNWDLRNYHWYNAFAFLNGKVGLDLAPAQMQTYFNPTIDLLYYGLVTHLPGPLAGFVMGVIHGLNFILVAHIVRAMLPPGQDGGRARLPVLLALAGMLSASFLSELGNSMGDNVTALFVLGSLLLVLRGWPQLSAGRGAGLALAAGVVMGLGVGLKLTVAGYALALCLALLTAPVRAALLFGIGVLGGMAVTGGHWYWKMAVLFGNPLFPQFNDLFHSPLAGSLAVADTHFLPHGVVEYLLWPFLFALDPIRVSQIQVGALAWPLLYIASIALAVKACRRTAPVVDTRVRMLLVFFWLSYLVWMVLFSIYRYLAPIELLAPLMVWLLMQGLLPRAAAGKVAALLIAAVIASSVTMGNWGHAGWARQSVRAEAPALADTRHTIVFTVQAMPATGWLAAAFPADLAFVALDPGFPITAGYRQRVASLRAARPAGAYVLTEVAGAEAEPARLEAARALLQTYGLAPGAGPCLAHPAWLGRRAYYYQLCPVQALKEESPAL